MRGAKPKPPERRAIEGDTRGVGEGRHLASVAAMPIPAKGARPPAGISMSARKVWRRLAPELERLGVLRSTDATAFATLCRILADLYEVEAVLAREGPTEIESIIVGGEVVGERRKPHHLSSQRNVLRRQFLSFGAEFAMTPTARARVIADRPAESSRLDRLRQRARGRSGA